MAKKQKKISVTPVLNKNLNSKSVFKKLYPVYAQIVYNRSNTLVSLDFWQDPMSERAFNAFVEDAANEPRIKRLQKGIEKVIRKEVDLLGDKFKLKGFGKRLKAYWEMLDVSLEQIILFRLQEELKMHLTKAQLAKLPEEMIDYTYMCVKELLPSVDELLSQDLKDHITAYFYFLGFEEYMMSRKTDDKETTNKEYKPMGYLDWLSSLDRFDFQEFLKKDLAHDYTLKNLQLESEEQQKEFMATFKADKTRADRYFKAIDGAVKYFLMMFK